MTWLFCLIVVVSVGQGVTVGPGCSWKAFPNTNIPGGTQKPATSLTDCQSACLAASGCVSLDYDPKTRGCWISFTQDGKNFASGIDHYDYVCTGKFCAVLGPRDCTDVRSMGSNVSGIYRLFQGSDIKPNEADVYCDFSRPGENWLVFQRRKDGSVDFERTWKDYEQGFGDPNGEFWLGNEKLSFLTMNRKYKLRIEMEDWEGRKAYAEYTTFYVESASASYRLTINGYSGNAGDSMNIHNGMRFSTKDVDNDLSDENCALKHRGAWWYNVYLSSNLNGHYNRGRSETNLDGIEWSSWQGYYYSLKATEMKIMAI